MTTILKQWRTVYKLTDTNGMTYNSTKWGKGVVNPKGKLSGENGLCGGGFYHAYVTPEVAAFLNPIHANIANPRFHEVQIQGRVALDGPEGILKLGATEMRYVRELPAIAPTLTQRVLFSIYCAGAALDDAALDIPAYREWQDAVLFDPAHLNNESAARSAESAARSVASAAWSAESVASAARSAESAARSAARSAESVASAARSAERSAESVASAAWSAESVASAAIILDAAAFALGEP